jgi:hypothetical protein
MQFVPYAHAFKLMCGFRKPLAHLGRAFHRDAAFTAELFGRSATQMHVQARMSVLSQGSKRHTT